MESYQKIHRRISRTDRVLGFSKSILNITKLKMASLERKIKNKEIDLEIIHKIFLKLGFPEERKYKRVTLFPDGGMCGNFSKCLLKNNNSDFILGTKGKKSKLFVDSIEKILEKPDLFLNKLDSYFLEIEFNENKERKLFIMGEEEFTTQDNLDFSTDIWIWEIDRNLLFYQYRRLFFEFFLLKGLYSETIARLGIMTKAVDKCNEILETSKNKFNLIKQNITTNEINEIIAGQQKEAE